MRNRTWLALLGICAVLLVTGASLAADDYDIGGRWLLEGGGYAEKGIRVSLNVDGHLDVATRVEDGVRYLTGYTLRAYLTASRLNIDAWEYKAEENFSTPIQLPELRPTTNRPFALPAVTVDGLTYRVTFTSTESGTVTITGDADIDVVGSTEINSDSAIWKEGTPRPNIEDTSSGCNAGWAGFLLFLALLLPLALKRRAVRTR